MSNVAVAQRYAQAIFELGLETSSLSGIVADVRQVADAYASSRELRSWMENPLLPEEARVATMNEISTRLGVGPVSKNAIGLLARRRRLFALPEIASLLEKMDDARAGLVRVEVTSAHPLTETYVQRLQRELEVLTGKRVALTRLQDPSLLAGVVVRIGDRVVDGSARARLFDLRSQLLPA